MNQETSSAINRLKNYVEDVEIDPLPWNEAHQAGFSIEWWDVIKWFERTAVSSKASFTKQQKAEYDELVRRLENSKAKIEALGLAFPDLPE